MKWCTSRGPRPRVQRHGPSRCPDLRGAALSARPTLPPRRCRPLQSAARTRAQTTRSTCHGPRPAPSRTLARRRGRFVTRRTLCLGRPSKHLSRRRSSSRPRRPPNRRTRRARIAKGTRRASPCSRERTAPSARTAGRRPSSLWHRLPRSHPHPLRASADIEPTFSRPVLWPPLPPECALRVRRELRRLR